MSLEFAIDHPCVLRARYSEQHLREWGRLGNLHTILTTGDQNAPSADKLKWIEDRGDRIAAKRNRGLRRLPGLSAFGDCRRRRSRRMSGPHQLSHRCAL